MGTIYKSGINYSGGGGSSLPDGGTTGQALVKKSDTNQDVEWKSIGSGGGAEFSIDSASNSGMVGQGNDYFGVNLNEEDTVDLSLIQPNVYSKAKTVPTKEYVDSKAIVQIDTMPTASTAEEDKIYQYVGATDSTFTNGYFYKCVFDYPDPTGSLEWMWKRIDVQPTSGSETLNEVLTNGNEATDKTIALKNSRNNGTTEIDSYGITQSYNDGAGLGNFAQLVGGTLQMSETNTNDDNTAYIGAKHMNMSSVDTNGNPLNHFVMEWSDVANVNMSDDLKEAWRNALDLNGGVGMTTDLLWEIPSDATVNPDTITLSKPVTDYDQILVIGFVPANDKSHLMSGIYLSDDIINPVTKYPQQGIDLGLSDQSDRYIWYNVDSATQLTKRIGAGGLWMYRIYGITFGSKLDGTIGRWEKLGSVAANVRQDITISDLTEYNTLALSSSTSSMDWNTCIITLADFPVGKVIQSSVGNDVAATLTRKSDTTVELNGYPSSGAVLYGYKETGISDADVQRIAQEVTPAEDTMKVTFTGATTIQSADKTFSEIKEALDAGKFVYAQRNIYTGYTGGSEVLYRVYRYDSSEIIFINNMMAYYGAASPAPNKDVNEEVVLTSGNVISSRRHSFAPIYYAETGATNPTTGELATIMLAGADNATYNTKKGGLYINQVVSGARTWVPISEPVEPTVAYSTAEQAIGTWVDGKTIYQKTMTCAMPTDIVDGTIKNTYVPHGVSNISQIIGCESVSKATSGNVGGEDGNMSVGNIFTHISADSYQINLSANMSEFSGKEYFVTFRYTKTT